MKNFFLLQTLGEKNLKGKLNRKGEMLETLEKAYQEYKEYEQKKLEELEKFFQNRNKIKEKYLFDIKKVSDLKVDIPVSICGVDSSYKNKKLILSDVIYMAVGVAYYYGKKSSGSLATKSFVAVDKDDLLGLESDSIFAWEVENFENEFLLKGIGALLEAELITENAGLSQYVFVDGSLFNLIIGITRAMYISKKFNEYKICKWILEKSEILLEKFAYIMGFGKIIAFPKRASSPIELSNLIAERMGKTISYRDYELVYGLFDKGEYIKVPVDIKRLNIFVSRFDVLAKSIISPRIAKDIKEKLLNVSLYYLKGLGGGVYRTEFFGGEELPVEYIYPQTINSSNEVEILKICDEHAKFLLNNLLDMEVLIDEYRE